MQYRKNIISECRKYMFSDVKTETHTEPFEDMFIDPILKEFISKLK